MFAPGIDGQALAETMVAPGVVKTGGGQVQLVRSAEGTIECWVAPTDEIVADRYARIQRTIVDIGPIRYDHPLLTNWRSIALWVSNWGHLVGQITNARYVSRNVSTSVRDWEAGAWHHVAWQWRLDEEGRTRMEMYVDGALASDTVGGKFEGEDAPALEKDDEPLPIQVGAMNTGAGPGKMLIDELRISHALRYEGPFDPPRRVEADAKTSLLFHFDGDLSAESGIEGVSVEGRAGMAG